MSGRTPRNRTDREVAKAIALQLPDVEIGSHHGTMDMRVRNRVFATFPAHGKHAVLKCTAAKLGQLTAENPQIYSRVRGDSWVQVALDDIDREILRTLLIEAWELAAPDVLRQRHAGQLASRVR